MLDYPAARAIALIVQTGSFDAAARRLGVTASAISQRVRNLEERLGTALIERGTPCRATETGALLCHHMEQVSMLEQALMQRLPELGDADAFRTSLSIATDADSLASWFTEALARFGTEGNCLLNITAQSSQDAADALRSGRVIAAVCALERAIQGCSATPLGNLRYVAAASPEFVLRHFATGVTPETLARAPALCFDQKDQLQQGWVRSAIGQQVALPVHWLPSTHAFVDGCLGGLGWALIPQIMVNDHLASGRLVELVPGAPFDRPLCWQISRIFMPQLSELTQVVIRTASATLVAPNAGASGGKAEAASALHTDA